jgi:hypothetical protein
MLSLLTYLMLTADVSAVACGSAVVPFLLLRACFPQLLMSLVCSMVFPPSVSNVHDVVGVIAAVGISVVGGPTSLLLLAFPCS